MSRLRFGLISMFLIVLMGFAVGAWVVRPEIVVQAQDGKNKPVVTVVSQSTQSVFRRSMTFNVRLRISEGKITTARLIYQPRATGASTAVRVDNFIPGQTVELRYVWFTRFETTPPFQIIWYRWELTDDAGNIHLTPREKGEITDNTHDWNKLSTDKIAVYWYDQDEAFGEELLDLAKRGYEFVSKKTGFVPEDELRVIVYNDQEGFCSLFSPGSCRDWYAGVTFGSLTVQWLIPGQERFVMRQVLPHELAHAFLNDWLDGRSESVPRWFNEGQATNNEFEGLDEELDLARDLASQGKLDRLSLLDRVAVEERNNSRKTAEWYAQAASLVSYLYEGWGEDSLGKILEQVREGKKFYTALEAHVGVSLENFELGWREWLGAFDPPPTIVPTPTLSIIFPPTPTYEPTPVRRSN